MTTKQSLSEELLAIHLCGDIAEGYAKDAEKLELENLGLRAKVMQLTELLEKHGICINCGEIFSHDIEEPFAHCGCCTSEWYNFTPYMNLEHKLYLMSNIGKPTND